MSLSNLISDNLNFAITQIQVDLTSVPSNGETYAASKQDVEIGFDIFEEGREQTIDTKFYINKSSYTTLPSKGMILTDGTNYYKVINIYDDCTNITRRIECKQQSQR